MRSKITTALLAFTLVMPVGVPTASAILGIGEKELTPEEQRAEVRKMAKDTLARLYKMDPGAKQGIKRAAGYAVFSNFGLKLGVLGSGHGKGLAVYNKTRKETFMKMFEAQGGLGFGGKTFTQVFVFASKRPLDDFINSGWEFGGQATGAAKHGETGAALQEAVAVAPGVWLYQMTETGFAAEMTAKGTKYYKDDDLN
jgi:lipid-binding SYLF domain-containing protein